jgi:phosphonate transport system substrate-binding protein
MNNTLPQPAPSLQDYGVEQGSQWSWGLRLTLLAGLLGAAGVIAGVAAFSIHQKSLYAYQQDLLGFKGLSERPANSLDERYRDADGDLLADSPAAPSECIDPEPLVLAHYLGDDEGVLRVDWESLREMLTARTGKIVTLQPYLHTPDEIAAVVEGEIHLVAAHSAEIPSLVNTAGLVPFAELGTAERADGNRLVIAVGPQSTATSLKELRGGTLICTEPGSVTGYRAAIIAIYMETGMVPGVDYDIYFSHKHERSIRGLAIGKFPFVALSHDVLERMLEEGQIRPSKFRVLFESCPLPRLTVGHAHQLDPEIRDSTISAVLDFENAATDDDQPLRFVPIDYKANYEFARRLDDAFDARFGQIFMPDTRGF